MMRRSGEPELQSLLAIDQDESVHRLLRAALNHEPIEIHGARGGEEGLRMAHTTRPDLILTDVVLPDMTGFDLMQSLQSDPRTHQAPVICMSDEQDTAVKVRCFDMGAIDFITKPFDVPELRARVRAALRVRGLILLLAQRAKIDGLSRLWNRSYFDQRLGEEVTAALRRHSALAVVMADIDHFKSVNDNYGHPFGDRVITEFARILDGGRSIDVACRYGGEEFALILPDTAAPEAATVADRFRMELQELCWMAHPKLKVTASFGVADLGSVEPAEPDALVAAADCALYAAKRSGRNRVEVFKPTPQREEMRLTA